MKKIAINLTTASISLAYLMAYAYNLSSMGITLAILSTIPAIVFLLVARRALLNLLHYLQSYAGGVDRFEFVLKNGKVLEGGSIKYIPDVQTFILFGSEDHVIPAGTIQSLYTVVDGIKQQRDLATFIRSLGG